MLGFLQGFDAECVLGEVSEFQVRQHALKAAVEIALLGLADESNTICEVLAEHGYLDSGKEALEFQCLWFYSGLEPPEMGDTSGGIVWVPSREDIHTKELDARKKLYGLPKWLDWNHIDLETLRKMREMADASSEKRYANAATGCIAMALSAQYAAVIHLASDLGRPDVVADLMSLMAGRMHASQQVHYMSQIPALWEKYFLTGWLREQLSLTKETCQEYARYVLNAVRDRVSHGRRRPEEVFRNHTIAMLLSIINDNTLRLRTVSSQVDHGLSDSMMLPGATLKQILATEQRIGRRLPDDMKEFFTISNGCTEIHVGNHSCKHRLLPLDQIYFEKEDYMTDYCFEVVPLLPSDLQVEWHGITGGGIAMYEHDGQGTQYVWIVGAEDIKRSKEQLQITYDKAGLDDKARIDRHIGYWYGDRQTYDEMTEYCYVEVQWGEGARAVWPSFKSYLANLAYNSQHTTRPYLITPPPRLSQ